MDSRHANRHRLHVHSGVATLLVADDGGPPLTLEARRSSVFFGQQKLTAWP